MVKVGGDAGLEIMGWSHGFLGGDTGYRRVLLRFWVGTVLHTTSGRVVFLEFLGNDARSCTHYLDTVDE